MRNTMIVAAWLALPAMGLAALAGCATTPPPELPAPPHRPRASHYVGTPLAGPERRKLDPAALGKAWLIEARVLGLDVPAAALPPAGPASRLVLAWRGGQAMRVAPRAAAKLGFQPLEGDATLEALRPPASRSVDMGAVAAALPPGMTVKIDIASDPAAVSAPSALAVALFRHNDLGYDLAVTLADAPYVAEEPALDMATRDAGSQGPRYGETLVLSRVLQDRADRVALSYPLSVGDGQVRGVLVEITVREVQDNEALATAVKELGEELDRDAQAKAAAPAAAVAPDAAPTGRRGPALAALRRSGAKPVILMLASETGASFCEQLALVADGPATAALAKAIADAEPKDAGDRAVVGWALEQAALRYAAKLASEGGVGRAELTAILVEHAGEVGRQPDAMLGLLEKSSGLEDLRNRLLAENQIALEDVSPAARVRAYDFLLARQAAPEGFDPLSSPKQRRAALERAAKKAAAPVPK